MGDEKDALALVAQSVQNLEESCAFLGGQNGCRLIQNQQAAVPDQQLDQFDPLLGAYRQLPDRIIQIKVELELVEDLLHLLFILAPGKEQGNAIQCQQDVFKNRVGGDQHEMLMDHADAYGQRIPRAVEMNRCAVKQDLASIRSVKAGQDVHQGAFAGTVLA